MSEAAQLAAKGMPRIEEARLELPYLGGSWISVRLGPPPLSVVIQSNAEWPTLVLVVVIH